LFVRSRSISLLLVIVLITVTICSTLTLQAKGDDTYYWVQLRSRQSNDATVNLGTMNIAYYPHINLPNQISGVGLASLKYNPAVGYFFVRWETLGSVTVGDPSAQSTTLNIEGEGTVTAIYGKYTPTNPTQHVGGKVFSANKAIIVAPYLMAVLSIVAIAAFVVKRRRI